jgi:predicted dithiol-disulfide oxidoreductase (DUF899 family)
MKYSDAAARLAEYRREIAAVRAQMRATLAAAEPQPVSDYEFQTPAGPVRLSSLFGDHTQLIVVHNMGTSCPNCTMWADGYNGIHQHVASRAAFVVSSPDPPEVQRSFAAGRGWQFPMVSHAGSSFAADMGSRGVNRWLPGISVFERRGQQIVRVADASFSPGDDFCTLWHFFDLLPGGAGDWRPRLKY